MSRLALVLLFLLATSCSQNPPDGVIDDRDETAFQKILLPDYETPSLILFGKPEAFICRGKRETVKELLGQRTQAKPFRDGYSYLDVRGDYSEYRAYFKEQRLVSPVDATLVFCSGAGASLVGSQCELIGVSNKGCFESGISIYSLAEIDDLALRAGRSYPAW